MATRLPRIRPSLLYLSLLHRLARGQQQLIEEKYLNHLGYIAPLLIPLNILIHHQLRLHLHPDQAQPHLPLILLLDAEVEYVLEQPGKPQGLAQGSRHQQDVALDLLRLLYLFLAGKQQKVLGAELLAINR